MAESKSAALLVVGDCNPDLVLRGGHLTPRFGQVEQLVDRAELTVGGSASITACGAARLGTRTYLAGLVGRDTFGEDLSRRVAERGVRTDWLQSVSGVETGLSVILSQGEGRAILTFRGGIAEFGATDVPPDALDAAAHLHVSSYYLQPTLQTGLADLLVAARRRGVSTSLDPGWDPAERWNGVSELLPLLDLILPNEQEARHLARTDDVQAAARQLHSGGCDVVVKLGARGALVHAEELRSTVPAPEVDVVDTTGAGDTFAAALLAWRLRGASLESSVRAGCTAGALSTRRDGGVEAQPDLDELERALAGQTP